jgi:hypothetical protein
MEILKLIGCWIILLFIEIAVVAEMLTEWDM